MINRRKQERERGLNIYSTERGNCGLSYTDHGGEGIPLGAFLSLLKIQPHDETFIVEHTHDLISYSLHL